MARGIICVKNEYWEEILAEYKETCFINFIGKNSEANETIATVRINDAIIYEKMKQDTRLIFEDSQTLPTLNSNTTETVIVRNDF